MAFTGQYFTIPGLVASGNLSSSQYKIVKWASTAGAVVVAAAATDNIAGVLMNDPADGEAAEVAFLGLVKVQCEASQNRGAWITSSTTGRAKTTSTGNDDVLGKLVKASSAAGDIVEAIITISNF